jgi:hypothetical protein
MYEEESSPRATITEAQLATLARIRESFNVRGIAITEIGGPTRGHKALIAANADLWGGEDRGRSWSGEWIIAGDGEVLSRAAAAEDPQDWLRAGTEPV